MSSLQPYDLARIGETCIQLAMLRLLAESPNGLYRGDFMRGLGLTDRVVEDELKRLRAARKVQQPRGWGTRWFLSDRERMRYNRTKR